MLCIVNCVCELCIVYFVLFIVIINLENDILAIIYIHPAALAILAFSLLTYRLNSKIVVALNSFSIWLLMLSQPCGVEATNDSKWYLRKLCRESKVYCGNFLWSDATETSQFTLLFRSRATQPALYRVRLLKHPHAKTI